MIFQGPDGFDKDLYGTPDSGTTWYRFAPSPDLLVDRVAALEAASANDLDDLADVTTAGVTDGDTLTYDADTSTWVPAAPASGGLSGAADVDDTGITDGQVLAWDADGEVYVPADLPTAFDDTYYVPTVVLDPAAAVPGGFPTGGIVMRRTVASGTFDYLGAVGSTTGGTTAQLTVPSALAAGTLVVWCLSASTPTGGRVWSASDSAGNTWDIAVSQVTGSTVQVVALYSILTTALGTGATISVTADSANSYAAHVCHAFSGVSTTSPTDVTGASGSASGTTPNTSTSTPGQADTLAIAIAGWNQTNGGAITPDAGWTTPASASQETYGGGVRQEHSVPVPRAVLGGGL